MEPAPRVPSARLQAEASGAWAAAGPGLVFAGCGGTDVALAQAFWNSVTLQPPLESCLGPPRGSLTPGHRKLSSANGRRRSLLADDRSSLAQPSSTSRKIEAETQGNPEVESVVGEKAQYLQKAKRRKEIIALLKKQREERIMKEAISRPHRPKTKTEER
uniref:Uncharacterized protein n=1 Tax=Sphaerodactylus townsendi TaxID=933632 RepID=A0ACB8EYE5_9SAUR